MKLSEILKVNKQQVIKKFIEGEHYYLLENLTDSINTGETKEQFLQHQNCKDFVEYLENEYGYENAEDLSIWCAALFSVLKKDDIIVHTLGENTNLENYKISSNFVSMGSIGEGGYVVILSKEQLPF